MNEEKHRPESLPKLEHPIVEPPKPLPVPNPEFETVKDPKFVGEEKLADPRVLPEVRIGLVRAQISAILVANGGKESNIPYPSQYWFLMNLLKSLMREV